MPDITLAPVQAVTPVRAPESATGKPQNNIDSERTESARSFADTLRNQRQAEARRTAASAPTRERERSASPEKPHTSAPAAPEQASEKTGAPESRQAEKKPADEGATDEANAVEDSTQTIAAPTDAAAQALLLAAAHKPVAPQQAPLAGRDAQAEAEISDSSLSDQLTAGSQSLSAAANPAQTAAKAAAPAATVAAQDTNPDQASQDPSGKATKADAPGSVASKADQPAANVAAKAEPAVAPTNFAAELERASAAGAEPGVKETSNLNLQQTYASLDTRAASAPELPSRQVIATPVGHRAWAEEVGQKLTWVATQDNGMAELVLTPPQLGRVEVSINLNGDQATAQFVAASQTARDALNDALPRLREMLAQAGIQLGQADVSAQHSNQSGQDSGDHRGSGTAARMGNEISGDLVGGSGTNRLRQGSGLVDTFA